MLQQVWYLQNIVLNWNLVHNLHFNTSIALKICSKQGSVTAVVYARFRNDGATNLELSYFGKQNSEGHQ